MNPFRNYPAEARLKAISEGIVRDVEEATGHTKTKISRTFAGAVKRPDMALVKALNDWLGRHALPLIDANGESVRSVVDKKKSQGGS